MTPDDFTDPNTEELQPEKTELQQFLNDNPELKAKWDKQFQSRRHSITRPNKGKLPSRSATAAKRKAARKARKRNRSK